MIAYDYDLRFIPLQIYKAILNEWNLAAWINTQLLF